MADSFFLIDRGDFPVWLIEKPFQEGESIS